MTQKDYEGKWGLEDLIPHVILFRILYDYFFYFLLWSNPQFNTILLLNCNQKKFFSFSFFNFL